MSSEVQSSFIHSFVSECLDASSKVPECVPLIVDDSDNDSVVQDIIMDKNNVGSLPLKTFCRLTSLRIPNALLLNIEIYNNRYGAFFICKIRIFFQDSYS